MSNTCACALSKFRLLTLDLYLLSIMSDNGPVACAKKNSEDSVGVPAMTTEEVKAPLTPSAMEQDDVVGPNANNSKTPEDMPSDPTTSNTSGPNVPEKEAFERASAGEPPNADDEVLDYDSATVLHEKFSAKAKDEKLTDLSKASFVALVKEIILSGDSGKSLPSEKDLDAAFKIAD